MRLATLILIVAVVVGAGACGAGDGDARDPGSTTTAKTGELPKSGSIPEGSYATQKFEPSFSFRIEERGWKILFPEEQANVPIYTKSGALAFLGITRVFDPNELEQETQRPVPENLIAWIEHHPYLDASTPRPASVGGVEGQSIDITAARLLRNSPDFCGGPCVPLFVTTRKPQTEFWISLDEKIRFVILEDVEGETVTIAFDVSPVDQFDSFVPQAESVLDSVEWKEQP